MFILPTTKIECWRKIIPNMSQDFVSCCGITLSICPSLGHIKVIFKFLMVSCSLLQKPGFNVDDELILWKIFSWQKTKSNILFWKLVKANKKHLKRHSSTISLERILGTPNNIWCTDAGRLTFHPKGDTSQRELKTCKSEGKGNDRPRCCPRFY